MVSLTDRIGSVGVVIGSPKQTCACRRLLAFKIFRIVYEMRIRGFMNHPDNAFAFHCGKIGPHHVVMRKIHNVAGAKGARRKRKKQSSSPQDRQSHHNPKSKRIYRAPLANWQEHLLVGAKISPVAAGADRGGLVYEKPGVAEVSALGYSGARSTGSFIFRKNFLSCDVTDITRSFPAATRRFVTVCSEKSFPESAFWTFASASRG